MFSQQSSSAKDFIKRFAAYTGDCVMYLDYGSHGFSTHKEANARKASYVLKFYTGKLRVKAKNIRPLIFVNQHWSIEQYRQKQK